MESEKRRGAQGDGSPVLKRELHLKWRMVKAGENTVLEAHWVLADSVRNEMSADGKVCATEALSGEDAGCADADLNVSDG
jgi:hypothetical protein